MLTLFILITVVLSLLRLTPVERYFQGCVSSACWIRCPYS